MRLVTFLGRHHQKRVGLRLMDTKTHSPLIIDATAASEWIFGGSDQRLFVPPVDMLDVIQREAEVLRVFTRIASVFEAGALPANLYAPESDTHLIAPIPRPLSIRDGYAFRQHVESARRNRGLPMIPEFDEFPVFYFTNSLSVTGPGEIFVEPHALEKLDYELEVAVVIGKRGKNIAACDADDYIFGYMIMNDWSARALQMEEMKLNLGPAKGKDFATSFGPYLVTRDELTSHRTPSDEGERYPLAMKAFVNGKLLSEGNLKDMRWTFAQIIERASYGVTLEPGEVIGSGTVGTGCLLELNGSGVTEDLWLKPGDQVVCEVEGLGRLENKIAAAWG